MSDPTAALPSGTTDSPSMRSLSNSSPRVSWLPQSAAPKTRVRVSGFARSIARIARASAAPTPAGVSRTSRQWHPSGSLKRCSSGKSPRSMSPYSSLASAVSSSQTSLIRLKNSSGRM